MTLQEPLHESVAAVTDDLRGLPTPWAVCGGRAIELWLGRSVRKHGDVDIAVFRSDQRAVREHLERRGWELSVARDGSESPWPAGSRLELPDHAVWCRRAGVPNGRFEVLLNESDGGEFVFRRDPAMRMPRSLAFRAGPGGIPILSPAIVLLYKAKHPEPTDTTDFEVSAARLDEPDRDWLLRGVRRLSPDHPWIGPLDKLIASTEGQTTRA